MAKKKQQGKIIQMLTPKKYIMQKARSLPIHECWINSDWNEEKLANITIARKHTNGNLTLGSYLIDLQCLGVKDTQYLFNISLTEYRDLLDHFRQDFDIERVDYTLVHNIIFAGLEYAEEYGFKPHKDFKITENILDEDTEDIELIEIECGHEGKPLYISGPFDSEVRSREIIAQLEKTAGPGNSNFISGFDSIDEDDDFWDDDSLDDDAFDQYADLNAKEKLELFIQYMNNIQELNDDEKEEMGELTDSILHEYLNPLRSTELFEEFLDEAEKYEVYDEINNDFIFGSYSPCSNISGLKTELDGLYEQLYIDTKKAAKKTKSLQKKYPKTPYLHFLELVALRTDNFPKYETTLPDYAKQFPAYSLIRILNDISLLNSEKSFHPDFSFKKAINHYFPKRKKIHRLEIYHLILLLLFRAMTNQEIDEMDAIDYLSEEFEFNEGDTAVLSEFITMAKFISILLLAHKNDLTVFEDDDFSKKTKPDINMNKTQSNQTFQFKIQLKHITHPPVWRRIKVPSDFTFYDFHYAIQISFGWQNAHLFQFSPKGYRSWPQIKQKFDDDFGFGFNYGETFEPHELTLSDIFMAEKQKFTYIYDFGDTWEHMITLEKIEHENLVFPKIETGKGQCPPEDCGGPWGYMQMKETLENPRDPEYKNYKEWLGLAKKEKWDPTHYDLEYHQKSLIQFFNSSHKTKID
ncbi:MAG: plasmid pRiA4b ORF-3 family protein [Draconibacterium sp.]